MKNKVVKFLVLIIIIIGAYQGYLYYKMNSLEVEKEKIIIDKYYIYGKHFNLEGDLSNIDDYDKIDLVLYNGISKSYKLKIENNSFSLNEYINKGILLDEIRSGKYYLFIRTFKGDKEKYYVLSNQTEYDDTDYYTLSKSKRKIKINFKNKYKTLMFKVSRHGKNNVYDIIIDPGHGGIDAGAVSSDEKYNERDLAYKVSYYISKDLEKRGVKVKMTRDNKGEDIIEAYNFNNTKKIGRAVLPKEVNAKYVFSIHLNDYEYDSSMNGFEIYTASGIDYKFAKKLAGNIKKDTDIKPSLKEEFKVSEGVYTHNVTREELSMPNEYENEYDVSSNSNYLYMIREPGGILTGAYVDKRNINTIGFNPYYDTNVGVEGYLLELGYLSNPSDLDYIASNTEEYAKVIADSIYNNLIR